MGRTNDDLCPVTALLSYLSHHGNVPGPLFHWDNHTPLLKQKFVEHVRRALLAANVPAHLYTGHSFRIGAATTAARLSWHRGLYHPNLGTLEKLSLPPLHQAEPLSSGKFVHYHGSAPHLTITGMSGYLIIRTK